MFQIIKDQTNKLANIQDENAPKLKTKWRNPYDEKENLDYDEYTKVDFSNDPGLTMQAPAEEQDINVIMKRFGVTDGSRLPRWEDPNMIYGDFSEVPTDPVEAQEMLRQGDVAFMTLPADIRARFESGAKLYNWLTNEKNREEAITLGLLAKPTPKETVSTSTSSDKEPLVPPSKIPETGKDKKTDETA